MKCWKVEDLDVVHVGNIDVDETDAVVEGK